MYRTFGQFGRRWLPALDWGRRNKVDDALPILIDTFRLAPHPERLGTVLSNISGALPVALLAAWSAEDSASNQLYRLAHAARRDQSIFQASPPLSVGTSARTQLSKTLKEDYLFAAVLEHAVPFDPSQQDWLLTLRTWVIGMAADRAMRGNVRDKLLRTTCDAIRLASDRNAEWGSLLTRLEGPADDLSELCAGLELRARQLPGDKLPANKTHLRNALSAFRRIAAGEESPDGNVSTEPLLFSPPAQTRPSTTPWFDPPEEDPENDPEVPISFAGASDGGSLIRSFLAKPNLSSARQLTKAKSVYLLDAASLHFLPWDWYKIAPYEREAFSEWTKKLQRQKDIHHRLTGLFASLCHRSGRSLAQLLTIEVSDEPADEWRLAANLTRLHRIPPSREKDWVPRTSDEFNWVAVSCDYIEMRLSPAETRILKEATLHGRAVKRLADLWHADASPRKLFLQLLPPELERLTPGMLSSSLHDRLFQETADPLFARTIASHPNTGLPGACAYANWHHVTVESALNDETPKAPPPGQWIIGGGSRFDPLESLIKSSIKNAAMTLKALQKQSNFIAFHNGYVTYVTTALWAATGTRAYKDPFESFAHFDLADGFVYVEDKSIDGERTGRIVPLPKAVCRMVDRYRRYLVLLADRLKCCHTALSERIAELSAARSSPRMPFLFMLQLDGKGLTWGSVSPESMESTGLFKWSVPPNLFRQRLAKVVRRRGLDAEIIDGLLGHSEYGCATYADDSPRIWDNDMTAARPIVEESFKILEFPDPLPPAIGVDLLALKGATELPEKSFGIAARALARKTRLDQVKAQAESVITDFLKGQDLTDLPEEKLWELSKLLLLKKNGMPRPTGYQRYQVMIEQLEIAWKSQGKRTRLSRRFFRLKRPTSRFTADGIRITSWHKNSLELMRKIVTERRGSFSDEETHVAGALLLCLEGRVANPPILVDVACGLNCQITHLNGEYDLEYAPHLRPDDVDAVVERFPISREVAACLSLPVAGDRSETKVEKLAERFRQRKIPGWLGSLARTIPPSRRMWSGNPTQSELIQAVANLVDQFNAQSLPGPLAAWYGGRAPSAALTRRDRLRLATGRIPRFRDSDSEDADADGIPDPSHNTSIITGVTGQSDGPALQSAAHEFLRAVSVTLLTSETEGTSDLTGKTRKALGAEINRTVREWNGKVSPSILLLAQWISALVRGKTQNKRIRKLGAVQRYFSGLAPAFRDIAYESDLLAMDDEEVTALYAEMIDSRRNEDTRAFADRLVDFHRWAATMGVEDPDWAEMPVTVKTARCAPGLLSEIDYQNALQLLAKDTTVEPGVAARHAFLLIGCYRFGLRRRECVGLARNDLVIRHGSLIAVIVRKQPWRGLKSSASRRLVPTLFKFTPLEEDLLKHVLTQTEAAHADRENIPMLMKSTDTVRLVAAALARPVQVALKAVTGNRRTTLHHARHTAANRIASAILAINHPLMRTKVVGGPNDMPESIDIELELLGRRGPNRSQSWAVGRFLGHAGTRTLWRSYLHINDLWARQYAIPTVCSASLLGPQLLDLDRVEYAAEIEMGLLRVMPSATTQLTLETVLQLFRLLARGKDLADALSGLALEPEWSKRATEAVVRLGRQVRISATSDGQSRDNLDGYALLRRVPERSWSRLLDWAKSKGRAAPMTSFSADERLELLHTVTGNTGQLLMWRPEHAKFLREIIEFVGTGDDMFEVRRTARWHQALDAVLATGQFKAISCRPEKEHQKMARTEDTKKRRKGATKIATSTSFEIDPAPAGEDGQSPARRAALVMKENASGMFRNKIELLVVMTACVHLGGTFPLKKS